MPEVKTKKDLAEVYRRGRLTVNRIEGNPEEYRMGREPEEPLPTIEQFRQDVPDTKVFKKIALFPFYSNRKAKVVDNYADRIVFWLGDYEKLAGYDEGEETEEAVRQMMADPEMYHFEAKIRAAIKNAKEFKEVIEAEDTGSFVDYVFSFHPYDNKENLRKLIADVQKRFDRYGRTTAMHVLMESGMCLPLIKPDVHMMQIFFRIGLVDKDNDIEGTWSAASSIAEAADVPISWIDNFVSLGLKDFFYKYSEVCGKEPDCNRDKNPCEIKELCNWWQRHYEAYV